MANNGHKNTLIGSRLKLMRERNGLKQKWVAKKMGVAANYLCLLERGERNWTPELVQKYEEALA